MDRKSRTSRYVRDRSAEATTRREQAGRRRDAPGRRSTTAIRIAANQAAIDRLVEEDPRFGMTTDDGRLWIDPFSGEAVPVEGDLVETARARFGADPAWRNREPLPDGQLQVIRWRHQLRARVPADDRLRMFGRDGRGWLNPFSGRFHPEVERAEGLITERTIDAMARALAVDPLAQRGIMLSGDELRARVRGVDAASTRRTATAEAEPKPRDDAARDFTPLRQDLSKARDVQARLQGTLPAIEGYDLGVHFAPQQEVSGDFYDAIPLHDDRALLFLGDVTGHGIQAALVAATALKALRLLVAQHWRGDLVELLCALNDNVKSDLLPGQFITLFVAELDRRRHRLEAVLAGHHQAVVANLGQLRVRPLGHKGAAIGVLPSATLRRVLKPERVELLPGDLVLQYTDGVTEAVDPAGEEFGLHRLLGSAFAHARGSMRGLCDGVAAARTAHEGPNAADDVTVLALKRLAEGTAPLAG